MADGPPDDPYPSPRDNEESWKRTIYCGGLRYETGQDAVREFFTEEFGPVSSVKVGPPAFVGSEGPCAHL